MKNIRKDISYDITINHPNYETSSIIFSEGRFRKERRDKMGWISISLDRFKTSEKMVGLIENEMKRNNLKFSFINNKEDIRRILGTSSRGSLIDYFLD